MEQVKVQSLVIGAGVIGLACARELANSGREVWVLEAHDAIGHETSSRNSEVIHAGIYYPQGSLKARFCVEGKSLLYEYLKSRNVPYKNCGKLIVATSPAQQTDLQRFQLQAKANGVHDLQYLSSREASALEPALFCHGALLSPSTGIFDSHLYMAALLADAEHAGATILFKQNVLELLSAEKGICLLVEECSGQKYRVVADEVISACGLHGDKWLANSGIYPRHVLKSLYFAKGNYFSLQGISPFSHLIYPVPEAAGLGVHLTHDLAGQARFGPDVEWVSEIDYRVTPVRAEGFYQEIRRYWPALKDGALQPDYSGIRPKLAGEGSATEDFCIQDASDHGIAGLINLTGIESPGLTASLAIARDVRRRLEP